MIELGRYRNLTVVRRKEQGVYLAESMESAAEAAVLLPRREVPEDTQIGEPLRVFICRDSADRLIATMEQPKLVLDEVKLLRVNDVTRIGAFLDWGLPKDLFLPFREMTAQVRKGEEVLAALYQDRSGRLAATMKVYPYLKTASPYRAGDTVCGRVYQIEESFGIFVAVDDIYSGLIPKREAAGELRVGVVLTDLRVTGVKEDGKLDLAVRGKAYLMIDADAEQVLSVIRDQYDGTLPFDDKADPEMIRGIFGISKAAFKRAVGKLYRERLVTLSEGTIQLN